MIAVIPVPAGTDPDFASTPEGLSILERCVWQADKAPSISNLIVLADDPSRLRFLESDTVSVQQLPGSTAHTGEAALTCEGLATLAKSVLAACPQAPELMCLDARNPLLGPETLESAIQAYRAGRKELLVSVFAPEDHPCQFFTQHGLESMGILHLFEDRSCEEAARTCGLLQEMTGTPWMATRPLLRRWGKRGAPERNPARFWVRHASRPDLFEPLRADEALHRPVEAVHQRIDSNTARVLLPKEMLETILREVEGPVGHELVGFSLPSTGDCFATAWKTPDAKAVVLRFSKPQGRDKPTQARVLPLFKNAPDDVECLLDTANGMEKASFPLDESSPSGFLFSLYGPPSPDRPTMDLPFLPDVPLWDYDQMKETSCLPGSKEPITGRQLFPEILALEGSIVILGGGILAGTREPVIADAILYPLNTIQRLRVDSTVSYLHYLSYIEQC